MIYNSLRRMKTTELFMRSWRNWQTRKTKDLVANTMQVQFLSIAPNQYNPNQILVTSEWFGFTFMLK